MPAALPRMTDAAPDVLVMTGRCGAPHARGGLPTAQALSGTGG